MLELEEEHDTAWEIAEQFRKAVDLGEWLIGMENGSEIGWTLSYNGYHVPVSLITGFTGINLTVEENLGYAWGLVAHNRFVSVENDVLRTRDADWLGRGFLVLLRSISRCLDGHTLLCPRFSSAKHGMYIDRDGTPVSTFQCDQTMFRFSYYCAAYGINTILGTPGVLGPPLEVIRARKAYANDK